MPQDDMDEIRAAIGVPVAGETPTFYRMCISVNFKVYKIIYFCFKVRRLSRISFFVFTFK